MDKEKFADALGIPRTTFTEEIQVHLDGNRRLVAEGHRGLQQYEPERIRLKGKKILLQVEGAGLCIEAIGAEEIVIQGEIRSVAFSPI